jgi:hypothetical protein
MPLDSRLTVPPTTTASHEPSAPLALQAVVVTALVQHGDDRPVRMLDQEQLLVVSHVGARSFVSLCS